MEKNFSKNFFRVFKLRTRDSYIIERFLEVFMPRKFSIRFFRGLNFGVLNFAPIRSSSSLESGKIRETCHKQKQIFMLPVVNLFLTEMSDKCHFDHFPPNSTRLKHELAIKGEEKKPNMKFEPCP